jgi:hypothetical protein
MTHENIIILYFTFFLFSVATFIYFYLFNESVIIIIKSRVKLPL